MFEHQSVLLGPVLEFLAVGSADRAVLLDGTLGGGGHSEALLERSPGLLLVGIDRDPDARAASAERLERFGARVRIVAGTFSEALDIVNALAEDGVSEWEGTSFPMCDRVLLDLGVSSPQLDRAERGFSFQFDGPLDMRMSQEGESAADLLNERSENELRRIFIDGGLAAHEAARLVREIVKERPITTTRGFAGLCERALAQRMHSRRARGLKAQNPATVPFQALRIAVNDEFGEVKRFLEHAPSLLAVGGRLGIISFHSLEDELVTREMRRWSREVRAPKSLGAGIITPAFGELLTKHAVVPTESEAEANPRARSARFRVFERTGAA